jgi:hypothetical protein
MLCADGLLRCASIAGMPWSTPHLVLAPSGSC